MRKILITLICMIFLVSFVSSAQSSYILKQGEIYNYKANIFDDVMAPTTNAMACLISLINPNQEFVIENQPMTYLSSGFFNYTLPALNDLGSYAGTVTCTDGTYNGFATFSVEVTYTGDKITSQQSSIYIFSLLFLIAFLIGLWFSYSKINGEHTTSENGNILQINFKGFLKPVVLGAMWIVCLVIIFLLSNIGLAFLPNPMIGNLFFVIYKIMFYATIVALPVTIIILFVKIVKSMELQRMIDRGAEIGNDRL